MKKSLKIVVDTSIFVNPAARCFFGKTCAQALTDFIQALEEKPNITCYIPPSVYEELMKFMENKLPAKKTAIINKKPPASYKTPMPALFLYEFIEEVRGRINKGLRIAEKYARQRPAADKLKEEKEIIPRLREEFRAALREGIIDSKEDFDLVLLAYELDACLATSDQGLIKWAQKLGITCLDAEELKEILEQTKDQRPKTED